MEAVVVDAGSKLLKAGIAAPDQAPPLVMPSKMKLDVEDQEMADGAVVEEVVHPVVRGFVKDWDAMEDLLNYVLYRDIGWEIGDEGQILFTEPLFTPKTLREQLVQLMFEKFNVSGFYASEQAVLSLYAVGRISGCTVDIGHGKIVFQISLILGNLFSGLVDYAKDTMHNESFDWLALTKWWANKADVGVTFSASILLDIAPVCEGAVQHIASKRLEIGGVDLTNLFAQELKKSNPSVNLDVADVELLKEQYACCTEDYLTFESIESSCQPEKHTLPDGQVGYYSFSAVYLTCFPQGFEDRFQREANLSASAICPSLVKPPEYMPENLARYSAWLGGAILAKVVFPQNQHVTKGEYDETGPSIVHKKCF
ncbi:Actin-related protein 7 [Zea mays]|uniref:Actin-related protein 7 n=1 Tax=Zea mays TaxID=4577 RepID=A0A1D6GQ05_MAIZE|nr:Actin-related protein 7 [Zea mays]